MTVRRGGRETGQSPNRSPWTALRNDTRILSFASALPTESDVERVQEFFAGPLPRDWISWVQECGSVAGFGRGLLGLRPRDGTPDDQREDALDLLMLMRLTEPAFPADLLPIEVLPERQLHCVEVGPSPNRSRVVLLDLDRPEIRVDASRSVTEFVYDWRNDLQTMALIVEEAESIDDNAESVLLRPGEWSTRRLCSQNVIVGLLQTRHNRETNEHDVAAFATATLTAFAPGAATRWALTTVLTEAHQAGGSLAVNFVRRSRRDGKLDPERITTSGQRLPSSIVRWAGAHGIRLDQRETRWDHETGERLFVAAAQLPASLRALLPQVDVSRATVCAAVTTGTWPALDVELVLRWAQEPTRLLTGAVAVSDRLRYLTDQYVVRSAAILSSVLRHLQRSGQESASDEDDTVREISFTIAERSSSEPGQPSLGSVTFTGGPDQPLAVGWPCLAGRHTAEASLTVRVMPTESEILADLGSRAISGMSAGEVLLVPADALARRHELGELVQSAESSGVCVLVAPDYTTSMDVAIAARLDRSRMSRQ